MIGTGNFGGSEFPCRPYSRGGFNRSLTLEGSRGDRSGLRVSRKIYTPFDGEFTRYLEVLENPLDVDVTVRVRIAGSFTTFNPVLAQSETGAFVMDGSGAAAGVGFVYKGFSDESVPAEFTLNGPRYAYEWVVTIPAGETRRLLHYFVQAPAGEFSSDLVFNLVDPTSVSGALDFLTDQELASIVNFVIQR
jgi:hypothetical protein